MGHPKLTSTVTVLPTVHSYVAETVARLGVEKALVVLNNAASIWENMKEPRLALAYRQALAKYTPPHLIKRMYNIRQMIVIADESGEGIEEIIESWPLIDTERNAPARVDTMENAAIYIQAGLRGEATVEDLGEGYFRIADAKPDAAGLMSMWMVELEEDVG